MLRRLRAMRSDSEHATAGEEVRVDGSVDGGRHSVLNFDLRMKPSIAESFQEFLGSLYGRRTGGLLCRGRETSTLLKPTRDQGAASLRSARR
jgi:hypothetical protein